MIVIITVFSVSFSSLFLAEETFPIRSIGPLFVRDGSGYSDQDSHRA